MTGKLSYKVGPFVEDKLPCMQVGKSDEAAARLLVMEVLTVQKCLFMLPCD